MVTDNIWPLKDLQNEKDTSMLKNKRYKRVFTIWALVLLAGCAGIGPGTVSRDRFDYVNAISNSWKKQMLLNLVKMRYVDADTGYWMLDTGYWMIKGSFIYSNSTHFKI